MCGGPVRGSAPTDVGLGWLAVQRGRISAQQWDDALWEWKRAREAGAHATMSQILLRRRWLSAAEVAEFLIVLKELGRRCAACGSVWPADVGQCGLCGAPLQEGSGGPERRIGKYCIVRELGSGGMATVLLVEDLELRRPVALKVLEGARTDSQFAERLRREALVAARLRHPNIVGIYEVGSVQSETGAALPYVAMEYIAGRTLEDALPELRSDIRRGGGNPSGRGACGGACAPVGDRASGFEAVEHLDRGGDGSRGRCGFRAGPTGRR